MIRAIIFDCFGVLTETRWQKSLSQLPASQRRQVRDVHHAYQRGFIDYRDFRAEAVRLTDLSTSQMDDIFIYRQAFQKNDQLLNLIKKLGKSYKMGVLSNVGTNWIRDTFLNSEEVALFDDMVLSFEVGLAKPDAAMYRLACQRLDVAPSEAILVDDSLSYCQAAEDVGLHAILYKDFVQFKHELEALLTNPDN